LDGTPGSLLITGATNGIGLAAAEAHAACDYVSLKSPLLRLPRKFPSSLFLR
jgi:hypothetical protein